MRDHSHRDGQVLACLFRHGPMSRAVLADRLGIRRNTIGDVCAALLKRRALIELAADRTRNVPLGVAPEAFRALGISHRRSGFHIAVVDAACRTLFQAALPMDGVNGIDRCKALAATLPRVLRRQRIPLPRLACIGFADYGIVDPVRRMSVRATHNPGWSGVPVGDEIERATKLPVWLLHFTDAMALMELRKSGDSGDGTALCLWLDEGVGLSVLKDGEPWRGDHAVVGEIGHVVLDVRGAVCHCGSRGCLETFTSIDVLAQRIAQGIAQGAEFERAGEAVTIDDIIANLRKGNKLALRVVEEAAGAAGRALAMAVNLFGVSTVLVMGRLTQAGDVLLETLRNTVRRECIVPLNVDVKLRMAQGGMLQAAEGAAYFALRSHLEAPPRRRPTVRSHP